MDKDKKSPIERMKFVGKDVEGQLKQGSPVMWHRIIMCVCIAFVGIAVMGGIILDFILDRQSQQLRHMPVTSIVENGILPEGQYYIYQTYFDAENRTHYLVSIKQGGVVVSALPPDGTEEPNDIQKIIRYDPASYEISVDSAGRWSFQETPVMEQMKAKQQAAKKQP